MGIFEKTQHMDPRYQFLEKYVHIMYRGLWTPYKYEQLINNVDAPHFYNKIDPLNQEVIRRCIMAVSLVEDKVKTYWSTLAIDIPQTIIGDVGGLFGVSEVTHRRSYFALAQALKVDTDNLDRFDALKGRINYLAKYLEQDPKIIGKKRVLKKLILFTSLVERCSLFTQFYILMSYAKHNKGLKTISALQQSTAIEEVTHYKFGIDVINLIKEGYPNIWDDYLEELIKDNIYQAYEAEVNLIKWFFENGVPEHLSFEEVVNFLNYNFNTVCEDLGLPMRFEFDRELFKKKSDWFYIKVFATSEPDFFDNATGGYAADDEEPDPDTINF